MCDGTPWAVCGHECRFKTCTSVPSEYWTSRNWRFSVPFRVLVVGMWVAEELVIGHVWEVFIVIILKQCFGSLLSWAMLWVHTPCHAGHTPIGVD